MPGAERMALVLPKLMYTLLPPPQVWSELVSGNIWKVIQDFQWGLRQPDVPEKVICMCAAELEFCSKPECLQAACQHSNQVTQGDVLWPLELSHTYVLRIWVLPLVAFWKWVVHISYPLSASAKKVLEDLQPVLQSALKFIGIPRLFWKLLYLIRVRG